MASSRSLSTVSVSTLDPDHFAIFKQGLLRVLYTDLAEFTMAQLIDGLPTIDVYRENRSARNLVGSHPLKAHEQLCEGALERTREFRDTFDPSILEIKSSLVQAFQDAAPGSRQFDLRLIEMMANAVHSIAVFLFNLKEKSHRGDIDSVVLWREADIRIEYMPGEWTTLLTLPPYPSIFTLTAYRFHEEYPHGLADVAAYWAEDRVFGGVFLFDRGESGTECKDVYLHSGRRDWTVRIWRLLESQLDETLEFLKGSSSDTESPFPLYADEKNRHRYDEYDAMAWHNVYRDPWERILPPEKDWDSIRRNTFDYPELQEELFDLLPDGPFDTIGRDNSFLEVNEPDVPDEDTAVEDTSDVTDQAKESGDGRFSDVDHIEAKELDMENADIEEVEPETSVIAENDDETQADEAQDGKDGRLAESSIDESEGTALVISDSQHKFDENEVSAIPKPELQVDVVSVPSTNESIGKEMGAEGVETSEFAIEPSPAKQETRDDAANVAQGTEHPVK